MLNYLNDTPAGEPKFPNLVGLVVYAQPTDRSRPILPYIVLSQEHRRVELLPTTGGVLSSQSEGAHFYNSDRGWTLMGYQPANFVMNQILTELTKVLENTELVLTDEARHQVVRTRESILEVLAYRMRQNTLEQRQAEDAKIAAQRAQEDREFDATVQAAAADPSPKADSFSERSFGTGVDITVSIKAPNEEVLEATKERLRTALRGAHFNF